MTSNGLVPLIRYRDVAAAIEWLSNAFGFEERSIVHDPDGSIAYAELGHGRGVVMLGPVGQSVLDSLLKQPDELDGIGTQSVYVAVDDVEAHFRHARAAGADIVLEFGSDEAGDRAYAARDPEGHVWNFGAYSPWPAEIAGAAVALPEAYVPARPPSRFQSLLGGSVAALAVATVAGLTLMEPQRSSAPTAAARSLATPPPAAAPVAAASAPQEDLAREAASLRNSLEREAHARQEAARLAAAVREQLARERAAREVAETEVATLKAQLQRDRKTERPATATLVPAESGTPPQTTGSLGEQGGVAEADSPTDEPAPPVTVQPEASIEAPVKKPAIPQAAISEKKPSRSKARPKTSRQSKASTAKTAKPKGNSGTNPFFLYD